MNQDNPAGWIVLQYCSISMIIGQSTITRYKEGVRGQTQPP